jgi:ribonuclease HII
MNTIKLNDYYDEELMEVGIDEVARGCLAGPVYAAAVIWPKSFEDTLSDNYELYSSIRDSKKISKSRRSLLRYYIEENAIDFSVAQEDNNIIDDMNILNATYKTMHKALDGLNITPDSIIVDGNKFKPYYIRDRQNNMELIPHKCFEKGDSKFISIACASILAKVYHDEYIENLVDNNPLLEKYGWKSNMCYGTAGHIQAIKEYGLTQYHRKTFGICKNYF